MPSTPLSVRDSIDTEALRPVVAETVVLASMLLLLGLATLLPGVGRSLPALETTLGDLIIATATVAVVVWLAHSIPAVTTFVRSSLDGPDGLVEDAARTAAALIAFLGVLTAYQGLAGLVVPTLVGPDAVWAYDLAFLALGLVPLAVIADRLRRNRAAVTDLVTATVADTDVGTVRTNSSDTT